MKAALRRTVTELRIAASQGSVPLRAPQRATPTHRTDRCRPATGVDFDAERAWALLVEQYEAGSRTPGSAGHRAVRDLLVDELSVWADRVTVQDWQQPVRRGAGAGRELPMTNVVADFGGSGNGPRLLLATHWDTRPTSDLDSRPELRDRPAPGACDGASGTAVLLELARVLHEKRPPVPVSLVFFDGEDLGEYCYGSRLFGRSVRFHRAGSRVRRSRRRQPFPAAEASRAVVVDMIGGRDVRCATEVHSRHSAPELWADLQRCAHGLGIGELLSGPPVRLLDDHVPLSRAGIPAALLIDFDYPYRHTAADTPEHCSMASLKMVGDVLHRLVLESA